jgi:peptidoglycan hydrolase-like protein with peptidoglycan-binding domain
MKSKIYGWLGLGLLFFFLVITLNITPVLAGYSQCSNQENREIPYCFQRGDSGFLIGILVEDLKLANYYKGRSTNDFNAKVENAVRRFQKDYRYIEGGDFPILTVDGIAGQDTIVRLCQATTRGCPPGSSAGCYIGSPRIVRECLDKYK